MNKTQSAHRINFLGYTTILTNPVQRVTPTVGQSFEKNPGFNYATASIEPKNSVLI
jgi:hypothetical protein